MHGFRTDYPPPGPICIIRIIGQLSSSGEGSSTPPVKSQIFGEGEGTTDMYLLKIKELSYLNFPLSADLIG